MTPSPGDPGNEHGTRGRAAPGFRIVSGGQSGVDRAALDAALAAGVPCGGWCPAGRLAEDGAIPARYPLTETPEADPAVRTRLNVRDSDATLILTLGVPDAGTRLAREEARALGRPCLALDLAGIPEARAVAGIKAWLEDASVRVLNVAGPRESNAAGITARARAVIGALLRAGR